MAIPSKPSDWVTTLTTVILNAALAHAATALPTEFTHGLWAGSSSVPDSGLAGIAANVMSDLGVTGAGLIIAVETLIPFLPSEVVLPLAGFTAGAGHFGVVPLIFATTIGAWIGALGLYAISRAFGRDRSRAVLVRIPLITARDLDKGEAWFARHGGAAVFLCRMVPVLRSLISVPAGVERMPVIKFSVYTIAGSAIWNSAFIIAGYKLGDNWDRIEHIASYVQWVVIAAVILALGWFIMTHLRRRPAG